jgi:hypothetical protein
VKTFLHTLVQALDDAAIALCGISALVLGACTFWTHSRPWGLGDLLVGLIPADRAGVIGWATVGAGLVALEVVARRWYRLVRSTRWTREATDAR